MDKISKEQRSRNMAAIRSKGNQTTELAFLRLLRANKITGWRRHSRGVVGIPDFIFPKHKLAIFIDGCFWHGCSRCKTHPKTNAKYWETKIANNQKRDKEVKNSLFTIVGKYCDFGNTRLRIIRIVLLGKLFFDPRHEAYVPISAPSA